MGPVVLHIVIAWAAIAVGIAAARWHKNLRESPVSGEFGSALGFIAAMFGLLLGLLVVNATDHYSDARTEAQAEATALVAMFDAALPLAPAIAEPTQHAVVCYARAIVGPDWRQMHQGRDLEAPQTLAATEQLRVAVRDLPAGAEKDAVTASGRDAGTARQKLLFLANPTIPTILWVLIYVGIAVLVFLIMSDLVATRATSVAGLASVVLMLTVVIGVLVSLDRPFSPLARVQPAALQSGLKLIAAGDEDARYLRPCTT